jgi:hypothetical protein
MTPFDTKCLDTFSGWLQGMPGEVIALMEVLEREGVPEAFRQASAESLAHLARSLDLIVDGVEALGHLENLFVFRAIVRGATGAPAELGEGAGAVLRRLAVDAELLVEFLGEDLGRLQETAYRADERAREGRRARDLMDPGETRRAALGQIRAWLSDYRAPELSSTEAELLKLRSFLRTRLGRAA